MHNILVWLHTHYYVVIIIIIIISLLLWLISSLITGFL